MRPNSMLGKCRGPHRYADEFAPGEKKSVRREQRKIEKREIARQVSDELDQDYVSDIGHWELQPGELTEWPDYPDDEITGYPDHYIINGDTSSCPCEEHITNDNPTD